MELRCELLIVGAGAAGLAAARVASEAGRAAIVLEARARVGGRIDTRTPPGLAVPVELGAEFVHGTPAVSLALLRSAGSAALDTGEQSFRFEDGALRAGDDPFETVTRVMRGAAALREDVSIEQFTRALPERERRDTRMMAAGFDAADPRRASTLALAEEWGDDQNGQTSREFRPAGGYAALLAALHGALDPAVVEVRLDSPVELVRRDAHGVLAHARGPDGRAFTVRARAAVVSVPLGVLQAGGLRFEPPLPPAKRRALEGLVMGPVIKLNLHFRRAFWETIEAGRFRDAAFFHNAPAPFPTYWTLLPQRAPLLVAWAGGPNADALAAAGTHGRVRAALDGLAAIFGSAVDPRAELLAVYEHDWQRDPFARGAYSYVATGGSGARAALAEPCEQLYFAGEALSTDGEAGTVAGALETGERAARRALKELPG